MRRPLTLAIAASVLSACVATEETGSSSSVIASSADAISSSSTVSSSSTPASSSSIAPSSSSSQAPVISSSSAAESSSEAVSSSSEAPVSSSSATPSSSSSEQTSSSEAALVFPEGDWTRGKIYYEADYKGDALNCTSCHGTDGTADTGAIFTLSPDKALYDYSKDALGAVSLAEYIYRYMPDADTAGRCDEECAADIAAYIETWNNQGSSSSASLVYKGSICDDRTTYGARQLKLLTRSEYQNSVEDLVGINFNVANDLPDDSYIHDYSNNVGASVTEVHVDSYLVAAERIAEWSQGNDFSGVINCSSLSADACAQNFVDNFAKRAFRRPLSRTEQSFVKGMFDDALSDSDVNNGIAIAMTAVLSSPQFLYRSEQGVAVSQGEFDGSQYTFSGATTELKATDLQHIHGEAGDLDGAWKIRSKDQQPAKLEKHLSYEGAGTLMEVKVKAGIVNGVIPKMSIVTSGVRHEVMVDWEDYRTIKVYMPGVSGHHGTRVELDLKSKAYDESYLEVHTIVYGEGELIPNAPDLDAYELTQHEIASYLSYTFAGTTPDITLLTAADNGELKTDAQIAAQVGRILESPRAKAHLGNFAAQWLGTDYALLAAKDPAKFPEINDTLRKAMTQEVRELFAHVVLDDSQTIESFFNADYTFVNETLANHYGMTGVSGDNFVQVAGGNERGGVLTTAAFMTAYGNNDEAAPIRRATAVRERLLCQHIPVPPPGIVIDREAAEQELAAQWEAGEITNRVRYHEMTKADYCQTCHKEFINPLGFGMEDFDTLGRYQEIDRNGHMIDAAGELIGVNSLHDAQVIPFNGAKELSHTLAGVDSAKVCFAENLFRFAMGTGSAVIDEDNEDLGLLNDEEKADYACSVNDITAAMVAAENDPKEILKQLGALKLVRYRKELNR